jgi:CBS domain-containing protein
MSMINRSDWKDIPISEVMTKNLIYVPNHITLAEAAEIMLESEVHQLVITGPPEGGFFAIGIITLQDIVENAV